MSTVVPLAAPDWELDYYSRPILEADGKKRWELLICSTATPQTPVEPFRWSMDCPASSVNSARSAAESGDHSAGLWITLFPAASAGANFHVLSMNGAFHGVITTAGPAGIRCTQLWRFFASHSRSS